MATKLVLLLYGYSIFYLTSEAKAEIDLETYFKESECIEEPNDDILTKYILTNRVQGESTIQKEAARNYRSELNLLVQYNDLEISFDLENEEGPTHKKIFNMSLKLADEVYYGTGKTKKEAKEMASREAIHNTSYKKPVKIKEGDNFDKNSPPTVVLNNLGFKHGYQIQYYMVDPMLSKRIINLRTIKNKSLFTNSSFWKETANLDEPPKSPFNVEVDLDGKSFFGKAHTIQSAKHEAATKAIEFLRQKGLDKNSVCTMKGSEIECSESKAKLKSPISLLYEYAYTRRLSIEFIELERTGPSHKPIFEMECTLGSEKATAKGRSKKEAKRKCAENMVEKIPELDLPVNLGEDETTSDNSKLKKRKKKSFESMLDQSKDVLGNMLNFFGTEENADKNVKPDTNKDQKSNTKRKEQIGHQWSPKEKLAISAQDLNLNINFNTISRQKSGFYSILNLDLNPTYICLGIGLNKELSQEYAALNALKFLYKLDLLEGVKEEELAIERFSFDNYIWLARDHTEEGI